MGNGRSRSIVIGIGGVVHVDGLRVGVSHPFVVNPRSSTPFSGTGRILGPLPTVPKDGIEPFANLYLWIVKRPAADNRAVGRLK